MSQFDIHRSADGRGPLLVNLQNDAMSELATIVVAPLLPASDVPERINRRLQPVFRHDGLDHTLVTLQLAAIPRLALGPKTGSLSDKRDDIIAALDFLFTGV